jgi:DNA recombination protein RmuC
MSGRSRSRQERMRLEFRDMANEIISEKTARNREEIDIMLKPFKDNIADFRERVERIYADENQQRGALRNEIKNLQELNRRITAETSNLTNALRGNSKVQGDWGEMILETILESSNLVSGIHYTTQENFRREDGSNVRPDVVLHLPGGKRIVIDSKVSLTAFVEHCSTEDAEGRKRTLNDHVASMRRHVGELGAKRYQDLMDSPDFVIMFVPNEPAFMAAMQADSGIWEEGYRKKVIVSSPTNLFALLKIVDDLWKRDSQSRNAIQIAEEGAKLYDKFVGFVETLEGVGKGLKGATEHYERAMNQLATGSGNLVGRTEKLRKLGVKASKELSIKTEEDS